MQVFIKRDATVITEDGLIGGKDAGPTLVRRFLRLFPGAKLIGPAPRRCNGFDVVPLEFIDPSDSVIINMDVLDSCDVWRTVFHASGENVQPQIMNFVWWPVRDLEHRVEKQLFALSCALFPTFASSNRTASEVREMVNRRTTSDIAAQARLAWVNLGFRLDHVQAREKTEVPIVLYPAIYLTKSKRPDFFREVVERVRARTPLKVEMRLHETNLVSEKAMEFSRLNWVWVGPLTSQRSSYYHALAHTTAFLATATEEAYGMAYVEAMGSGVIGVFPDLPWARALLPDDYPYLYSSASGAEDMLYRAITEPEACRAELDAAAGGSFTSWINEHHSDDAFDREVMTRVSEWFQN